MKPTEPKSLPERDTLADAIIRISDGLAKLERSKLNRRAIVILLKHETGLSIRDIENVIDGLGDLARQYTK